MNEAQHHQQTLEQREQALEVISKAVHLAVFDAHWVAPLAGVSELRDRTFTVINFDGNRYKVTIEEQ